MHRWGARQSCTKTAICEVRGHQGASTDGTSAPPSTSTGVTITTSPRRERTGYCQLPNLTPMQHLRALTKEIGEETSKAAHTPKGRRIIKSLQATLKSMLAPKSALAEVQRVETDTERQQRVIDDTPIVTITRIKDAPPMMKSRNPTSKSLLKLAPRTHWRMTRSNTPGAVPPIHRIEAEKRVTRSSKTPTTSHVMPRRAIQRIVTRQAINVLTTREKASVNKMFVPTPPILNSHCNYGTAFPPWSRTV